ncbi:Lycopene cyclase [Candidatus Portiera aleyrodidarum]|uniref:Lycopene cyclase protein n=1 Tax=Candidatus Portiera aleyrodidarum TV TaxID=1297582 RepID=A0A8D3X7M5_9GAMM|nr:lycopene cyclase family protein [Candidatus Portiera aleyrodidarum]AGI27208.1 lycopene cyclase protein [Candidatus Portiera aleyrodidarum TV]CEI59194.1 Lycopene cyclase [Candidatus Portiera aleyrodidarum]
MLKTLYDIDILILGGGCTGLSLAYYLSYLPNKCNILIIENKTLYHNDKTWCGWRTKNHAFITCCTIFWYSFYIKKAKPYYSIINSSIPYEYIRSIFFYKKILNRITNISNIQYYKNKIINIKEYKNYISIKLNTGKYTNARWVIDTIPKQIKIYSPWQWQTFFGIELYFNNIFKNFSKPYLMNFYLTKYLKSNNFNFIYILPIKKNKVLFEWTIFSNKDIFIINNLLIFYINMKIGIHNYKILRKETGHIPMAYIKNQTKINHLAKLYGCYIRTSNGFSFHQIQQWAIKGAYNISINKKLIIPNIHYFFIFLDYIFMRTIERYPNISLLLYNNIFYYINSNSLIYFFTNTSTILDILNIVLFIKPKVFLLYTIFMNLFNN